jgi:hypothetical protein
MLFPALENKLRGAVHAFDAATADNIVGLCKQYLALLAEYRAELYKLPGTLGVNQWSGLSLRHSGRRRRASRRTDAPPTQENHTR